MTVEQVWEYGKERGVDWYSPKPSTSHGKPVDLKTHPYLMEFNWGSIEPAVEINLKDTMGYQAMPFDLKKAFGE